MPVPQAPFSTIVASHTPFTPDSMAALVQALRLSGPSPPVTHTIIFNFTDMSDEACALLLEFAWQCPLLATLELFGNKIGVCFILIITQIFSLKPFL